MKNKKKRSPEIPRWILERFRNKRDHESLLGDYEEIFETYYKSYGRIRASMWYWKQVIKAIPSFMFNSLKWRLIMFKNYFKIAIRNIIKYKGYSTINIFGLAIGMACCILILFWVNDELNGDRVHKNAERIHRVIISEDLPGVPTGYWPVTPAPLADVLKKKYHEVEDYVRLDEADRVEVKVGNRAFRENDFIFADPSIFTVFTFQFISGDPARALQDPQSLVLTKKMAKKYFGNSDPLGKILRVEGKQDLTVSGVVEELPANSHFSGNFFAHINQLKLVNNDINDWGAYGIFTYLYLKEKASPRILDKKIRGYIKTRNPESKITLHLQHLPRIYLYSHIDFGMPGGGDISIVILLSVVALLILLIACINFINLSTARSANRCKEIGLRKVVGGQRRDLIFQFFGESNIMALIALMLALLLTIYLLPSFNLITGKELGIEIFKSRTILLGLLGITLFTGLASGIYPALLLSSFHPVRILKGLRDTGTRGSILRKILVVTQFTLSVVMIIGTVVIYKQLQFMKNKDLGFDKERLVYIHLSKNRNSNYITIKNELLAQPGILQVTAASGIPAGNLASTSTVDWQGKNPQDLILFYFLQTDNDYLNTIKVKMSSGRFFSKDKRTDRKEAYIINEAAVRAMGMSEPIGKQFSLGPNRGRIVGVIEDYNFRSLHRQIEPLILRLGEKQLKCLIIRIAPEDIATTISSIKNIWEKLVPGVPFDFGFIDEKIDSFYRTERRMGKLSVYAAGMAVLISCLGLFGLASYTAEQKRREIGIRKVLGANVFNIIGRMSIDFTKWVFIGNIVAWPIAYLTMKQLLQNYAYRTPLEIDIFIGSGLISLIIAFITVAYQTIKAANTNPVNTLKHL